MGILFDQAFRLLRDEWSGPGGAQSLSQELYLILTGNDPVMISSPVQIANSTGEPALSISNTSPDAGSISITGPVDAPVTFAFPDGTTPPATPTAAPDTGGGGTPGKVFSGSGSTYRVQMYPDGVRSAGIETVTQLQIDPAETIPAGTWCIVIRVGTSLVMQVPVWL